jgi:mannitol 2-dehydrogenase
MNTTIQLNQKNLHNLPDSFVVPTYDRSKLKSGIVHIGVGGFHRSHEACYNDDFLALSESTEWGICGMGLREADRKIGDILKQQDYLYTLIVKHPDGHQENRVIGSLVDFVLASDDPSAATDRLADVQTKIVSLTITEGGYHFNSATNAFDFDHSDVQHDLANPQSPKMIFGFLAEALRKRRAKGLPAFTIQSCDNIQHNGDITRKMLLAFAEKQDPELAQWIAEEVRFPNAMVDRITPMTTLQDIALLKEEGVQDLWPVTCEPFTQWIIEDHFSNGRPAWESVGAQFVQDVTPYELMKIRLLNAGHSVLGLLGSIHGHATIDGCIADPLFASYVRRFMDVEATPILAPVDGINLDEYKSALIERFGNPNIKDNLARICLESSSKLPKFIIPTMMENLEKGGSTKLAALVIAAWCYYSDKGVDKDGVALDIMDDIKLELHDYASKTEQDSLAFLKLESVFGELIQHKTFTDEYVGMVKTLYTNLDIAAQMHTLLSEDQLLTA